MGGWSTPLVFGPGFVADPACEVVLKKCNEIAITLLIQCWLLFKTDSVYLSRR